MAKDGKHRLSVHLTAEIDKKLRARAALKKEKLSAYVKRLIEEDISAPRAGLSVEEIDAIAVAIQERNVALLRSESGTARETRQGDLGRGAKARE